MVTLVSRIMRLKKGLLSKTPKKLVEDRSGAMYVDLIYGALITAGVGLLIYGVVSGVIPSIFTNLLNSASDMLNGSITP
jgi:hypothetical protein